MKFNKRYYYLLIMVLLSMWTIVSLVLLHFYLGKEIDYIKNHFTTLS